MRNKKKLNLLLKILIMCIALLLVWAYKENKVYALSYSITCPSTATVGETVNVGVSGTAESWQLSVQINGTEVASQSHMENNIEEVSFNVSGSYTFTSAGTYTLTIVGNIATGIESPIRSFASRTITVTDPTPPPVDPEPENPGNPESPENPDENGNQTGEENQDPGENNEPTTGGETGGNTTVPQPPVQEPEPENPKNGNNHLSSLTVDVGTLTPAFNRDRIEYTLKFPDNYDYKNLKSFKITAYVEDSRSRVEGNNVVSVEEGDNVFVVRCIAEDGTPREYKINVYKPIQYTQSDLRLKGMTINTIDDKGSFNEIKLPEIFSPEKFEYELDVDSNITDLDIKTDIENKDIIIKIEGEKALRAGNNTITITLISPTDENVKTVYTLRVHKEEVVDVVSNGVEQNVVANNKSNSSSRKKYLIMIAVFVVILAVAVIVLLVINHRNKFENDFLRFGENDDEDDEVIIGKKDKSYLKDENLEKFEKRYEEIEKKKNEEQAILDEKIKEEKPEFKREVMIDATKLDEINANIEEPKIEESSNSTEESEINKKLDELMEKKVEKQEIKSNDETDDNFSKEDFFNDINKKRGKHF